LHIGAGDEAPDFEYRLDEESGALIRFSLARLLAHATSAPENLEKIGTPENLRKFLEKAPWQKFQLYALQGEARAFWKDCQSKAANRLAPLSVRETCKTAYKRKPLLPGSSLKGALLTGWHFEKLWQAFPPETQNKLFDVDDVSFANDWSPWYDKKKYRQRHSATPLEETVVDLLEQLWDAQNPEWAQRQLGKLSDRLFIPDVELAGDFMIQEMRRESGTDKKALPQWIECVAAKATGGGRAKIDDRETTLYSRHELCRRVNRFARALLVAERQFFNYIDEDWPRVYEPESEVEAAIAATEKTDDTCVVRLGWGSNKNATSISLLNSVADLSKPPDEAERRRPKTRWMAANNTPLGWCKVEFEEGDYVR
jgi:CRISPR type III-A-associated RAMP protein Csm5